jgi:hypothetical protein
MRHAARDASAHARAVADKMAEQGRVLEEQRQRAQGLARDLILAQREVEHLKTKAILMDREMGAARQAAYDDAVRNGQGLAAERQRVASLTQELTAARADLEAVKTQMAQQTSAASRARQVAEALVNRGYELTRERTKAAALEQSLVAARREIDALKDGQQTAGDEREQALRRELAAARVELDTMRRGARDASAQARAVADTRAEQGRVLEEQRQTAEGLARDLILAQRKVKRLEAKAVLVDREMGAAHAARQAAEASQAEARRALDEERHKAERFERDLAAARQSIDALEASANLAAAARAAALQGQQVAEAEAKRVGKQLALEHERADSVARDLDGARSGTRCCKAGSDPGLGGTEARERQGSWSRPRPRSGAQGN